FELGAEQQRTGLPAIIEWLFAQRIACQVERSFQTIPDGECKHPVELLHGIDNAPAFKAGQHDLGIRVAVEMGASVGSIALQLFAEIEEIVDFAVKDDDVTSAGRNHGLMASRREIHNCEAAVAQGDAGGT